MKTKLILTSFLALFVTLFNESIFAYALRCDEVSIYCNYQGMFKDIDNADEEFEMLMEPPRHSNFRDMFSVLLYIIECSKKNKDCMDALKNPNCKMSVYTQKLVNFYEDNIANIDDEEVIELFKILRNGEGKIFFNKESISNEKNTDFNILH